MNTDLCEDRHGQLMRLVINATCLTAEYMTGIERFAQHMCRELYDIDSAVKIISSQPIAGVPFSGADRLLSSARNLLGSREYLLRALWDQTVFRRLVAKERAGVVFFPIQDGMLYPPVKQIVTVHDFDISIPECRQEINSLRKKMYQYKMPHILKNSDAVVAVSEFTKQSLVSFFDINPQKIHVIYNGYDEKRFKVVKDLQPILERYGLHSGKYFLFVGSILRHKNIINIVRAFANIKSETSLVIVGSCKDSAYLEEIRKVVVQFNVSESQFRYLEYVSDEDIPYLYNGAIAYLLPSFHEGFGVPIIEAMACGTPVITAHCTAMPEVAGGAALLVDPYSFESIASAMCEISNNTVRAEELKNAGFERVKQFRWSYSARKLYDLCKAVSES